ncbi:porin [Vibrio sinaloensis]|uniref:porin n=1 Tax=Photobacterium sp. (strain ATCC 43367) TaxID=379097 RepID=UPI0006801AE4|nr:porin [Vibrio sinaloensis]
MELYNQDGVTVDLTGDVEIRYKKSLAEDSELKQEIDDADFGFDTRYAVNDDLQVGAFLEFSGDNSDRATGNTSVGNVYFGFYHNEFGTLKVGKLDTQLDDAGIGSDYLFGVQSFFQDADFGGEEAVRYDLDKGNFYFGLGLIQDKHNAKAIGEDGRFFDLKVGARVADFDFTAFYGNADLQGTKDGNALDAKESIMALEARFAGIEDLNLEAGYYRTDNDPKAGDKENTDTFAIAADYTMGKVSFAGGVSNTSYSKDGVDSHSDWFLNTGYGIAPNTTVYAEVGGTSEDGKETGYGVGIKASF